MKEKAVILLSGGLDSTTCLALAKQLGFKCFALTIDYGQRNAIEIKAAQKVATKIGIAEHKIIPIGLNQLGGSALLDQNIQVPDFTDDKQMPTTYVPARNSIFLTIALAWAEVLTAQHIFIGTNYVNYSGYPDCRPEFIETFQSLVNVATKATTDGHKIKVHAPLMYLSKAKIIEKAIELKINLKDTLSCYQPDERGRACGRCDSCALNKQGFSEAGLSDETLYQF